MVHTILDKALQFFQEPKNQERIQTQCINPLLSHILDRVFPYIILTCILFSLIFLMSLTSVGLLVFQLRQSIVVATSAAASAAAAVFRITDCRLRLKVGGKLGVSAVKPCSIRPAASSQRAQAL
jgi:hypothetical protein